MKEILIVDDSRLIRKAVHRMVTALGFRSREAENGLEALARCREAMPDAVLLDWNMPVMDGLGFLGELRKMENGRQPKVLFCTTETEVPQIVRALQAGADEYIMKPFTQEIVASKLGEVGIVP